MFNQQGSRGNFNNNGGRATVNTRLYSSYADDSLLTLYAWNENISVKFHPVTGVNADGLKQYAQENTDIVNTSLVPENCIALLAGIEDNIIPALEEKKAASVSITSGSGANKKVLSITTDGETVKAVIFVSVSEEGVADPNNKIEHTFKKRNYLVDYNPETGSGDVVDVNTDFEIFVQKISEIYNLDASIPHAIKYFEAVRNNYNTNRYAASANNVGNTNYQAPTTNYTSEGSISDFLPFN